MHTLDQRCLLFTYKSVKLKINKVGHFKLEELQSLLDILNLSQIINNFFQQNDSEQNLV